jgi:hypothetical protein
MISRLPFQPLARLYNSARPSPYFVLPGLHVFGTTQHVIQLCFLQIQNLCIISKVNECDGYLFSVPQQVLTYY